ncbi:MAG: serine/threonine protein kinase [Deltaproteobacteria bacterium]|nr:serine/threonine protein kinase [Deltaproteobacteria bacterium]
MAGSSSSRDSLPTGVPRAGETVAGKYVVEHALGVGGMGAVVAAKRLSDGLGVAIKVMLEEEAQYEDSTKRFFREARAVGALHSPHVNKLLDFGRLESGLPYMVLELLEGSALDAIILQPVRLPIETAVGYILQACEGVAEAHANGIIHRDLKPSNLYRVTAADGSAVVKVLDFGISKATMKLDPRTDGLSLTDTDTTLGSPQYMSPEQLRSSRNVDVRTDIWSLGMILFKLLTGKPVFDATTVGEHFAMILADPPTPLRNHRPEAPLGLERAILVCLEKDREERWQDVGQLALSLAPFGPPDGAARAARAVDILDSAGASAPSLPHPPLNRDAATVIEGASRQPVDIVLDENAPTSTWSPSSHTMPPPPRPGRVALIALTVGGAVVLAFVAGFWLSGADETGTPPTGPARTAPTQTATVSTTSPTETTASKPTGDEAIKASLLAKLEDGSIDETSLRSLLALCEELGDEGCYEQAEAELTQRAPPKRTVPRPATQPKKGKEKVKVKGPMEDTL